MNGLSAPRSATTAHPGITQTDPRFIHIDIENPSLTLFFRQHRGVKDLVPYDKRVPRISNRDLKPEDVPPSDSAWSEIVAFAHSFNGYEQAGSFFKAAQIANERRHGSLTDLRICLFFEQRRFHHCGNSPAPDGKQLNYIRSLLELIRPRVMCGEFD